jgi:hypothetical protein
VYFIDIQICPVSRIWEEMADVKNSKNHKDCKGPPSIFGLAINTHNQQGKTPTQGGFYLLEFLAVGLYT